MSRDFQHCPDCQQEYVAGIAACVDCGQPLQPGPLARFERGAAPAAPRTGATAAAGAAADGDVFVVELPGIEAHEAVQALLMEKIACRATCTGLEKRYSEASPPQGALATSLPVSIFVAAEHVEAAQEIIDSLKTGDLIGEQWSAAPHPDEVEAAAEDDFEPLPIEPGPTLAAPEPQPDLADLAPAAQSTSGRTIVLLIVVAVIVGLVFALARQ
ncbi:MAG: hypothetical protein SF182_05480 [Deltaproteobacteria bacterium]|nr:hypothetical protein [Deltaproteobacteria bacterium]